MITSRESTRDEEPRTPSSTEDVTHAATASSKDASWQPNRRTVLKGMGIGALGIVAVGGTVVTVRALGNGVFDAGEGSPYELWSSWKSEKGVRGIVAAGVLAANPHNIQPWQFVIGPDSVDIYSDSSRVMPVMDSDGRERAVGFGCVIENMIVAARARGFDAVVTPGTVDSRVARVDLAPGWSPTQLELNLESAIAQRHSNRGPYADSAVSATALAVLAASSNHHGAANAQVAWVTDPDGKRALGDLYVEATQAIIDDRAMSEESFAWFRNNRFEIDNHRDGLTLDGQGMSSTMLAAAKILPAESRTAGDQFWLKSTREIHTATAAAYGVIRVGDVDDFASRLDGGRLLQHIHLTATANGVAMQHMNQITERIARDSALHRDDQFGSRWAEIIRIPAQQGLVSFRLGYPARDAAKSPRRRLNDVVRAQ